MLTKSTGGDRVKRSTKRIIETFPKFKSKLKAYENILLVEFFHPSLYDKEG